jgi:transposase
MPVGINNIAKRLPNILEDGENDLPGVFRQLLQRLGDHLKELDRQVDELSGQIQLWHKENELSLKLADIPGIGPITASALVASIGDAKSFENGRQLAAWLGLVPRQHSTGRYVKLNIATHTCRSAMILSFPKPDSRGVLQTPPQRPSASHNWPTGSAPQLDSRL